MSDIDTRIAGRAGRITLTRPQALNALSYEMCLTIEKALDAWRDDPAVDLVIIDAEGEKAFCAGGDIAEMYRTAVDGDYGYGRSFWADEYRMNAKIAEYPKPYVSLMQGFTMGGGVGVGGHASHRIVGESSKIAMPEIGIGLIPDVGGTLLLARAPGHLGEYYGLTAARMGTGDAILSGFADTFVPEAKWPALIAALEDTGKVSTIADFAQEAPEAAIAEHQGEIDTAFSATDASEIEKNLAALDSEFAANTLKAMRRGSPISVHATLALTHAARQTNTIRDALEMEYRFTWRSAESGDFLEGVRAAIIDKDRNPSWKHDRLDAVSAEEQAAMLAPIPGSIDFEGEPS